MGNICLNIRKQLLKHSMGGLCLEETRKIEEHLSRCQLCRNHLETLKTEESLFYDFGKAIQPVINRIENDVINSIYNQQMPEINEEQSRNISIWATIATSRIARLTAAVIVIGVFLGLFCLRSNTTYAITDLPKLMQSIKTMHMKGFYTYDSRAEYPEQEPAYIPIEFWVDIEKGKIRKTDMTWEFGKDSYNCNVVESVWGDQYTMQVSHTGKTVKYFKPAEISKKILVEHNYGTLLQSLYGDPEQLNDFTIAGHEKINGTDFDIWEKETATDKIRVSMSPVTGRVANYSCWYHKINGDWTMYSVFTDIECDVDLQEDVFDLNPPDRYTMLNTKETAIVPELPQDAISTRKDDGIFSLKFCRPFVLNNGCVIIAWSNQDTSSGAVCQDKFFEGLQLGGTLPKLPIELYAVRSQNITYTGYHLAYTKKNGIYYEWAVYVPDTLLSSPNIRSYKTLTRSNSDNNLKFGSIVESGIPIESCDDFEIFIGGVAAELSDGYKIPGNLNYYNALKIASDKTKKPICD